MTLDSFLFQFIGTAFIAVGLISIGVGATMMNCKKVTYAGRMVGVQSDSEAYLEYPSKAVDFYQNLGWVVVSVEWCGYGPYQKCYARLVAPKSEKKE
jgi:hypothetical protein